jgi:PAS domain-containing protein
VVTILAIDGLLPLFFVPGYGSTPIRHILLDLAAAIFAFAAIMLRTENRKSLSPFYYWYSYALGLIAVGLFGTVIPSSFSSALFWAGRAGQWLGGVYMLIAAIASVRESNVWDISLEAALQESEERFRSVMQNMSEGLMLFDAKGNVIYQNPASLRIHGLKAKADEPLEGELLRATWKGWDEKGRPLSPDKWPMSRVFRGTLPKPSLARSAGRDRTRV